MSHESRVVERIANALEASPGVTARELVAVLAKTGDPVSKADVNASLYREKYRFWNDGATPPRWQRLVGGSTNRSRPEKANRTPSSSEISLYAWQAEALAAWRSAGHRGVVEAVTGTGKTMLGIVAARDAVAKGGKAQVIVPSIELLRQWTAQLKQWLPQARIGALGAGESATWYSADVVVAVVNSARAYDLGRPGANSVLVADECHRYGSEANALALDERFTRRLGLSATYARSDEGNEKYLDPYFGSTCFRMGYQRAVADEVTAHFKVALLAVPFAPGERAAYDQANKAANEAQQWLIGGAHVRSEPFGEFMKDVSKLAEGDHGRATGKARMFLSSFAERRRILAETATKRHYLGGLAPALRAADRAIIFTQTVEAAEDAAGVLRSNGLNSAAIHSQMNADERRRLFGRFAGGNLKAIAAPQVLDEGVDVPAADLAVILASSRTRRQMIQRMGRVLRRKEDGRLARFAVLYVEGSSEDPARGAHGEFLEEIVDVADDVATFPIGSSAEEVCRYLNEMTPASPPGRPRMEGEPPRESVVVSRIEPDPKPDARAERDRSEPPPPTEAILRRPEQKLRSTPRRSEAMDPVRHRRLLAEYRRLHPRSVERFADEVSDLMHQLRRQSDFALLEAIARSPDPREIAHVAKVRGVGGSGRPTVPPVSNPVAPLRGSGGVSAAPPPPAPQRPASSLAASKATPAAPAQPRRQRGPARARRYCAACGLLEEACRC